MQQRMQKHIQIGDWIYELKAVRAIKVKTHGEPYEAIVNININGQQAYIDGLMTKDSQSFTRQDFDNIIDYCRQLHLQSVQFDRYKNQKKRTETIQLYQEVYPLPFQAVI